MDDLLVIGSYLATFGGVFGYAAWLHIRRRKLQN